MGSSRRTAAAERQRCASRGSRRTAVFLLAACWLGGCVAAQAATLTVAADRDATLIEDSAGALANGSGDRLFSGATGQFGGRRALVRFDLTSIPPGSTIASAELALTMDMTRAGSTPVLVHRVLGDWGEGASASAGGIGAPAAPGDATWLHRFYPSIVWSAPGGDFAAAASASTSVGAAGPYTWGPTVQLAADVKAWVDNPSTNFGWILVGDETTRSAKRYLSREAGASGPRLTVVYTPPPAGETARVPVPGLALALLGAGLVGIGVAAQRRRVRRGRSRCCAK